MRHQDSTSAPRPLSEADRRWLDDALKSAMVDLGKRMADIKDSLDAAGTGGSSAAGEASATPGASLEEREQLLDELMDLVDQIDLARGEWKRDWAGGDAGAWGFDCRERGAPSGPLRILQGLLIVASSPAASVMGQGTLSLLQHCCLWHPGWKEGSSGSHLAAACSPGGSAHRSADSQDPRQHPCLCPPVQICPPSAACRRCWTCCARRTPRCAGAPQRWLPRACRTTLPCRWARHLLPLVTLVDA